MNKSQLYTFLVLSTISIGFALFSLSCITVKEDINYESVYLEAEKARKAAASYGNEWRDTYKLMESSKQAAKNGDYKNAIKLATKAKQQYMLAINQVIDNEEKLNITPFYDPNATPEEDIKNIQSFFRNKFPRLSDSEFANGFYAMDPIIRVNWEAIEEFPPYIPAIEEGESLWNTQFSNSKSYIDCFSTSDVLTLFPRWDKKIGEVETLPMAINKCRNSNGEKALKYGGREMLALQAFIAHESRGAITRVGIPRDDKRALEAYKQGKKFYFSRRGQLNLACYHCHFYNAGNKIRANVLGPALGQTTHWPTYRSKWGGMGTLHRRYKGCNKQVRAKPFDLQSTEYRNLEYFHTFISNGIPTNGPGARF